MNLDERRRRDAIKLLNTLEENGFEAKLAGGCVRDRLMNLVPKDYDIACNATPSQICALGEQKDLRVIPTGLDHGTVTIVLASGPVEVTTLRTELANDGRHAEVSFDDVDFQQDARRRDFTINALYEDAQGKVIDYVGGQKDLEGRVLRFVGRAEERIQEDYLRILRFFRFWAHLNFNPDTSALTAIGAHAEGLRSISQERITDEILKTLACDEISEVINQMLRAGVFEIIFPNHKSKDVELRPCKEIEQKDQAFMRIAQLHGFAAETLANLGPDMRLSQADQRKLSGFALSDLIQAPNLDDATLMENIDVIERHGSFLGTYAPAWRHCFPASESSIREAERREKTFSSLRKRKMPIDGVTLMNHLGLKQGRELGETLQRLKTSFRNGEWSTAEEGLATLGDSDPQAGVHR